MNKSSVVWDFFTLNGDQVKCGLCRLTMKHNRTFTSNMMRHMRLKHITVNLNRRRLLEKQGVDDPGISEPSASNSDVVSTYFINYRSINI